MHLTLAERGVWVATPAVAQRFDISVHHLQKIAQTLVRAGELEESDMNNIKHTALVLFTAVGALAAVTTGASAKAVAPAQACSGSCTSSIVSAWDRRTVEL